MKLTDIEASFFRYLYENLEVAKSVKVLEDINLQDFEGMTKWVVIDPLTNSMGDQPKGMYFLHIAVRESGALAKEELIKLVDTVYDVINKGVVIPVYSYSTGVQLGAMEICETNLSPMMPHFSGGIFRSMTVGVVYAA